MYSKTRPLFILLLVCLGLQNHLVAQNNTKSPKIRTIIIDAGHGGSDVGARGAYSTEAQITLQLALRLDTLLRNEMPDTRIVMTRTTDIYHHVREKADIAKAEIVEQTKSKNLHILVGDCGLEKDVRRMWDEFTLHQQQKAQQQLLSTVDSGLTSTGNINICCICVYMLYVGM
jgi:hypothetical protein